MFGYLCADKITPRHAATMYPVLVVGQAAEIQSECKSTDIVHHAGSQYLFGLKPRKGWVTATAPTNYYCWGVIPIVSAREEVVMACSTTARYKMMHQKK
jgi:hypothetical protein